MFHLKTKEKQKKTDDLISGQYFHIKKSRHMIVYVFGLIIGHKSSNRMKRKKKYENV